MRKPKRLLIPALLVAVTAGGWAFWKYAHWNTNPNDIRSATVWTHAFNKKRQLVERQIRTTDKAIIRDLVDAWNGRARILRPMIAGPYGFVSMERRDGSKIEFAVEGTGHVLEGPEGVFFETSDRARQELERIIGGYIESAEEAPIAARPSGAVTELDRTEKLVFQVKYRVLDRFGMAVPNACMKLMAIDETGQPYGADFTWSLASTDANGFGESGFGTMPPRRPGKLLIVAEHPSIKEFKKAIEWKEALSTNRAERGAPIILEANAGPGLRAWRVAAAAESPQLVAELDKADKEEQIASLTRAIAAREMMAVPALLQTLLDYDNPRRQRFIDALLLTWNGCRGVGPAEREILTKARAIYDVQMCVGVLRAKPQGVLPFLDRINALPRDYANQVLKEMQWVIVRMQAKMIDVSEQGQIGEAAMMRGLIEKWQDHLAKVKKAIKEMPDHVSAAIAAEQSFHAACDEWSAAQAKGEDTAPAAVKITRSYSDFIRNILQTRYIPCAALLVPGNPAQVVGAGKLELVDGSTSSYVIWSLVGLPAEGVWGLEMSRWNREAWIDKQRPGPRQGIAINLRIEPSDLRTRFAVGKAEWAKGQKNVLRVSYTLEEIKGVIEIYCGDKDHPWSIHPDRGVIRGDKWLPFPKK